MLKHLPLLAPVILHLVASTLSAAPDTASLALSYAGIDSKSDNPTPTNPAEKAWQSYEKSIGVPLRKWAAEELAPKKGGTVFYPFSGPDFVSVAQMFPEADRYIMVAIQPAGPIVDPSAMSAGAFSSFKSKFNAEWSKFGYLGFFRTIDLNENTASTSARLTATPVMMAFAARLGFTVKSVDALRINKEKSEFEPVEATPETRWNSVRLNLSKDSREVSVDYLMIDLSDSYLANNQAELDVLKTAAKNPTLLKAASHLLPKPYFSKMRTAIVENTPLLVQDETGLEYPDLKKIGEVKLYGKFTKVLELFNQDSQRELAKAYAAANQTSPLPFAYSYQKSADRRSLQIVRRPEAK
jgi:hypothetical protein